jgi:hypothetical protein
MTRIRIFRLRARAARANTHQMLKGHSRANLVSLDSPLFHLLYSCMLSLAHFLLFQRLQSRLVEGVQANADSDSDNNSRSCESLCVHRHCSTQRSSEISACSA